MSPFEPTVLEPRLGAVGVSNVVRAVGAGVLAGACLVLIALLGIGVLGESQRGDADTFDAVARALAGGVLAAGLPGGAVWAVAATVRAAASGRVLEAALARDPQAVPSMTGLRVVEPAVWGVPWGLTLLVLGFIMTLAGGLMPSAAWAPIVAGIVLLALGGLLLRGVVRRRRSWQAWWQLVGGERRRRLARARSEAESARAELPQGPSPTDQAWRTYVRLDRAGGWVFLAAVGCVLLVLVGGVLGSRQGVSEASSAGMVAVAVLGALPVGGTLGLLVWATSRLVAAERATVAWAHLFQADVAESPGVRYALAGPRASWFVSLTLSTFAGLAVASVPGVQRGRETWGFLPSSALVLGVAGVCLAVALVWGLMDLSRCRAERYLIRRASRAADVVLPLSRRDG